MSGGKKKRHRAKEKSKRRGSPYESLNISQLDQHRRIGSKLLPPLAQLPNMSTSSWSDDHLPEMIWAVILTGVLERNHYLNIFRKIAVHCRSWFLVDDAQGEAEPPDHEFGPDLQVVVDQTKLAEVDEEEFRKFISIPLSHPLGYAALRPILLIDDLPGIERWRKHLGVEPDSGDWHTLAMAVAGTLDHQSEASTDIRWLKVIIGVISGRMKFPESFAERLEEFRLFPDKGDMRSVRPSIRSMEMMLRRPKPAEWIPKFWAQVLRDTKCIDPSEGDGFSFVDTEINSDSLYNARDSVIDRFRNCITADRVNPRLDGAFGMVLYAVSILEEIGMHRIHNRIVGAISLRALVEACITLRYLEKNDTPEIWRSFRVYGAGQAKLAFLKAQQVQGDLPGFMDEAALMQIANEDTWQEFLPIDVGHWANSNLRKLAIDCGAKDIYDQYYDWSSAYIHGSWAAVRDTNYVSCHNPLHRLHRIPRGAHRSLSSVERDAVFLVNQMIAMLDRLFPGNAPIPSVEMQDSTSESGMPVVTEGHGT